MRINKIKINKYKSIERPIIINNLSNLNILVGPNNSGKTNILDAIELFFKDLSEEERFKDNKNDIEIEVSLNGKKESFSSKEEKKIEGSFIRIRDDSSIYQLLPKKLKEFKDNFPKEYLTFSKTIEKSFKNIEINEELFIKNISGRPITRMGEGFKRIFVILFYLFHPQYRIILIDEPALHLHPFLIKKLLYILDDKRLKNQVFLTTHHPTFVQAFYLKNIWRVSRDEITTKVNSFKKGIDTERLVQEINDDNSGMLFSDKVLLVEGVSDKIFMKEMLKRFYKKEKDIKVVDMGGKGVVDIYAEICNVFDIPYAVILDRDALYSPSLLRILSLKENIPSSKKINILKKREIFILKKDLEEIYPRKYGREDTKPLTALHVSRKITKEDFNRTEIKEILETI